MRDFCSCSFIFPGGKALCFFSHTECFFGGILLSQNAFIFNVWENMGGLKTEWVERFLNAAESSLTYVVDPGPQFLSCYDKLLDMLRLFLE